MFVEPDKAGFVHTLVIKQRKSNSGINTIVRRAHPKVVCNIKDFSVSVF